MITAVDTNILVDVLVPDQRFGAGSNALLEEAFSAGPILVCDVVYAELSAYFTDMTGLENFLAERAIRVESLSRDALFDAGQAWWRYRRRREAGLACTLCGARTSPTCPQCGEAIKARQHMVADFIVGAHALARADRLLTRDPAFFRTYFPELRIES